MHWRKESIQQIVLGNLDLNRWKTDMRFLSLTLHTTQLQMDQTPQHKTQYFETAGGKSRKYVSICRRRKRPLK